MTILITGANRGIGRGLRDAYAARGEDVIGTSRRPMPGLVTCDVTNPASVAGLPDALGGRPLDLLVCNAGVYPDKGHRIGAGYGPEVWTEAFATNVTGVFLTIEALLPALRAARGKVAILSSIMASDARAPGGSYAYRASKAAALNLGRNLATDLRGEGIAVGIYHPGWVRTDMGGPGADIDLGPAVAGLLARFDALDAASTGCFLSYDGSAIAF
jgi:NAD(P)-dependent dehydrogenase (short-subunit alcohol dehydrogenase family)